MKPNHTNISAEIVLSCLLEGMAICPHDTFVILSNGKKYYRNEFIAFLDGVSDAYDVLNSNQKLH